jgi:hypothetical protein
MKRFSLLVLLLASLLAFHAARPEASASWGCGAGPPQCTYGGTAARGSLETASRHPRHTSRDPRCAGKSRDECARPG